MRTTTKILAATTAAAVSCVADTFGAPPPTGPIVNLGYATYQGIYNNTYGLNVFKG
jgi:hypothetical protein